MMAVVFKLCRKLCRVGEKMDSGVEPLETKAVLMQNGSSTQVRWKEVDKARDKAHDKENAHAKPRSPTFCPAACG